MDEPRIRILASSHLGKVRENQEDSWGVWEPKTGPERRKMGRLMVVADGIGGSRAGEVASRLAVDTIIEAYPTGAGGPPDRLRSAVRTASQTIVARAEESSACRGMGTTVVAAVIHGDRATVAWVGDSRAYLIRDRELICITRDHHGGFNKGLSRWLGAGIAAEPDIRQITLRPGDRLLLCTDGLHNYVDDETIVRSSRSPIERWPEELIQATLKGAAGDNVTVVTAHIDRLPFAPHLTETLGRGVVLDGMQIRGHVGEDQFHRWYLAETDRGTRLLCVLKQELQEDLPLLLELEEEEESLARVESLYLASVEMAGAEKSLGYVCLRLPWRAGENQSGEIHSLDVALAMLNSARASADWKQALRIATDAAAALDNVRRSMLPAGAPHPSDFWGNGDQYVLCRWPSPARQYGDSTSRGLQANPLVRHYIPPDFAPGDLPGTASDAYFIGWLITRLAGASPDSSAPPVIRSLLGSLLADRASLRPDPLPAVRDTLADMP